MGLRNPCGSNFERVPIYVVKSCKTLKEDLSIKNSTTCTKPHKASLTSKKEQLKTIQGGIQKIQPEEGAEIPPLPPPPLTNDISKCVPSRVRD